MDDARGHGGCPAPASRIAGLGLARHLASSFSLKSPHSEPAFIRAQPTTQQGVAALQNELAEYFPSLAEKGLALAGCFG